MTPEMNLVVFSDLDGTLLDHDTYDWRPAAPALDRLAALRAAVVLTSSKTASEMRVLQHDMGLTKWPAIIENGAGILGQNAPSDYDRLRAALDSIPADLRNRFTGFGDVDAAGVTEMTGLSPDAAARACDRMFSEPGLWSGDAASEAKFVAALADVGVTARHGGRFLTLSFGKTKADRMDEILDRYKPRHSVALGDAPNDVEMIEAADFGIVIANPHRAPLPPLSGENRGHIHRTTAAGPAGWNTAMMALLDRLGL